MTSKQNALQCISVCIANYNGADMLRDCIDSVYAQRGNFRLEVLVHDDASTDDSLLLLRSNYPNVRVIESRVNVGFCISNNRMVEAAEGDYLLLLNNDAVLRPGSLEALHSEACNAAHPALLGLPQYTLHDGSLVDCGYEFDLFMNPIPVFSVGVHEVATVTGACL